MSTLSEELIAARKAKHMTQEQLASAMNASRSAVSHWESGRNEPDLDTLHRLSEVLDCTFSIMQPRRAEAVPPMPDVQTAVPPEVSHDNAAPCHPDAPVAAVKPSIMRKLRIPVLCIAALALILGAVLLLKPAPQPVKAESAATTAPFVQPITAPDPGTPEWFATATEPQNGMPFVTILFNSDPLYAINDPDLFGDQPGWYYTCYLTETSGQPFTIRNLRLVNFMDHKNDIFDYSGEQVSGWFGSSTIPAHGQYSFTGGFSMVPEIKGIGFSVTGVTENGTEMEFHSYLTLVAELSE